MKSKAKLYIYIYIYIYIYCPKSLRIRQLFLGELEFKSQVWRSVTFIPLKIHRLIFFFQIFTHFQTCNIQHTLLVRVVTALSCRRVSPVVNLQYANRGIGRGRGCAQNWPARSPDRNRMYFHLLKHVKNMYKVKIDTRVE